MKWAYEPLRPEDVPAAIARGYHLAMQPPRGPVFISVPMDDWNKPCQPVVARRVSQSVLARSRRARRGRPRNRREPQTRARRWLADRGGRRVARRDRARRAIERGRLRRADRVALGVSPQPSPVSRRIAARAKAARGSARRVTTRSSSSAHPCSSTTRTSPATRFGAAQSFSRSRIRRAMPRRRLPGRASSETSRSQRNISRTA